MSFRRYRTVVDSETGELVRAARPRVFAPIGGPSLTRASEADGCDLNKLVELYHKTGSFPPLNHQQHFLDLTNTPTTIEDAMQIVIDAEQMFMSLPADIREMFGHSPQALYNFVQNPENKAKAEQLGLLAAEPKPTPPPVDAPADGGTPAGSGGANE